jgi:hypothetical protein
MRNYFWRTIFPIQVLLFGYGLFTDKSVMWAWIDLFFMLTTTLCAIDAWLGETQ